MMRFGDATICFEMNAVLQFRIVVGVHQHMYACTSYSKIYIIKKTTKLIHLAAS
jgi:hypothetical protein